MLVVRMVEPRLMAGMAEQITLTVLALHHGLPLFLDKRRQRVCAAT